MVPRKREEVTMRSSLVIALRRVDLPLPDAPRSHTFTYWNAATVCATSEGGGKERGRRDWLRTGEQGARGGGGSCAHQ